MFENVSQKSLCRLDLLFYLCFQNKNGESCLTKIQKNLATIHKSIKGLENNEQIC